MDRASHTLCSQIQQVIASIMKVMAAVRKLYIRVAADVAWKISLHSLLNSFIFLSFFVSFGISSPWWWFSLGAGNSCQEKKKEKESAYSMRYSNLFSTIGTCFHISEKQKKNSCFLLSFSQFWVQVCVNQCQWTRCWSTIGCGKSTYWCCRVTTLESLRPQNDTGSWHWSQLL